MRLAPLHWANALFLWLSLATVLVPAIGSSGSPLRLTEGSAFSAFTSDVSLGPTRAAPIEDNGAQQSAPVDGDGAIVFNARANLILPNPSEARALSALRPGFADPPPQPRARFAAGAIGARAPPYA
jgi:hypothetical protein